MSDKKTTNLEERISELESKDTEREAQLLELRGEVFRLERLLLQHISNPNS